MNKLTSSHLDRLLIHGRVPNPDAGLDENFPKYLPLPIKEYKDTDKRAPRLRKEK